MASKYQKKKEENFVISEENAIEQISTLLEYYDIDIDAVSESDETAGKHLERGMDTLAKAVRRGQLEVTMGADSRLQVIQTLRNGETLTYSEVNARAKVASEKYSDANYSRVYAFMGSLAGVGKMAIEKLDPRDLSTVEVLSLVFTNA